jgi:hypothetical protein
MQKSRAGHPVSHHRNPSITLEEAVLKLDDRQRHPAQRVRPIVARTEHDLAVLDPLQPAVADLDAERAPAQVVEHRVPAPFRALPLDTAVGA